MVGEPCVLTLDTVCVIYLADPAPSHIAAERLALEGLVDAARTGHLSLQLTASHDRDLARLRDDGIRAERLRWLSEAPLAPRRAAGVARFDVSVWDGPDVRASDEEAEMSDTLRRLLIDDEPLERAIAHPTRAAKLFSDVDHLLAHWRSAAAAFVTIDAKLDCTHRAALAELGITLMRPSEAAAIYLP